VLNGLECTNWAVELDSFFAWSAAISKAFCAPPTISAHRATVTCCSVFTRGTQAWSNLPTIFFFDTFTLSKATSQSLSPAIVFNTVILIPALFRSTRNAVMPSSDFVLFLVLAMQMI